MNAQKLLPNEPTADFVPAECSWWAMCPDGLWAVFLTKPHAQGSGTHGAGWYGCSSHDRVMVRQLKSKRRRYASPVDIDWRKTLRKRKQ